MSEISGPTHADGLTVSDVAKIKGTTLGWADRIGFFFKECLAMIGGLDDVDLFVSRAAAEVVRMYRQELKLPKSAPVRTRRRAPCRSAFYYGTYHTLVVGPDVNTVAKCVFGISDRW